MESKANKNSTNTDISYQLGKNVNQWLLNSGLAKLLPFAGFFSWGSRGFAHHRVNKGEDKYEYDYISFLYDTSFSIKIKNDYLPSSLKVPVYWNIVTSEGVVIKTYKPSEKMFQPAEVYPVDHFEVPVYVRLFWDVVIDMGLRQSFLFITDQLPYKYEVKIYSGFKLKKAKEDVLRRIAGLMLAGHRGIKSQVNKIVSDSKRDNFKKSLDKIINLASEHPQKKYPWGGIRINYSFCLACGKTVKKHEMVCPRKDKASSSTWHCMNSLDRRLDRRLGLKGKRVKRKEIKDQLYSELQEIISRYPLYGYDEFKSKHPEIYEPINPGPEPKNVTPNKSRGRKMSR